MNKYKTESEMIEDFLADPKWIRNLPIPYPYEIGDHQKVGKIVTDWAKKPHIVEWKQELHIGDNAYDRNFVDIVALTDFGEFVAIEAKLSASNQLYVQAKSRLRLFPYVYVLVPSKKGSSWRHKPCVSEVFCDACQSIGIGIITITPWIGHDGKYDSINKIRIICEPKIKIACEPKLWKQPAEFYKARIKRRWDNNIHANSKGGSKSPRMGTTDQIRRLMQGQAPMSFKELRQFLWEHGLNISESGLRNFYCKGKGFKTRKELRKLRNGERQVTIVWYEEP